MEKFQCIFRLQYSNAQSIALLGAFNNWSTTSTPMLNLGGGRWQAAVELPPGDHAYCYFAIENSRITGDGFLAPTAILNEGSVLTVPHDLNTQGKPLYEQTTPTGRIWAWESAGHVN